MRLIAGILIGLTGVAPVQAADALAGKRIAERWCASCHLVTPGQAKASDGVPTFASIASRKTFTAERLTPFLSHPHPVMPDMTLSRSEIADLVAYIRSLD